jgi:hypothetical protein
MSLSAQCEMPPGVNLAVKPLLLRVGQNFE